MVLTGREVAYCLQAVFFVMFLPVVLTLALFILIVWVIASLVGAIIRWRADDLRDYN